jgi:hypothetical protein
MFWKGTECCFAVVALETNGQGRRNGNLRYSAISPKEGRNHRADEDLNSSTHQDREVVAHLKLAVDSFRRLTTYSIVHRIKFDPILSCPVSSLPKVDPAPQYWPSMVSVPVLEIKYSSTATSLPDSLP